MPIAFSGRALVIAGLAAAVCVTSGCSWFRKGNDAYKLSAEARPLEVPPELNLPDTSAAMQLPQSGTAAAQAAPAAAAPSGGFVVAGQRDAVYEQVGTALAGLAEVKVVNRAQLLGSYDVSVGEANFLVRVVQTGNEVYVSAIDARGVPETRAEAQAVMAHLKTALGGR